MKHRASFFTNTLGPSFKKLCASVYPCLSGSLHNLKKLCASGPTLRTSVPSASVPFFKSFVPQCLSASPHSAKRRDGFTLIELLLVVVIIGVLLAVIVPRAWRANIDTKYATLRQTCVQLSGFANDWAERELERRPPTSASAVLDDYMQELTGDSAGDEAWIAASNAWTTTSGITVEGEDTTSSVQDLAPTDPPLRNPFTGLEVFQSGNNSSAPGAIACAYDTDGGQNYYALIFRSASDTGEYYAGQDTDLAGLRNGIFINKLMPRE